MPSQDDVVRPIEGFSTDPGALDVEVIGHPISPAPGVLVWRCAGDRVLVEAGPSCTVRQIDVGGICQLMLVPGRMIFGPPRSGRDGELLPPT